MAGNRSILPTNITSQTKTKEELEIILNAQNITAACLMEQWLNE